MNKLTKFSRAIIAIAMMLAVGLPSLAYDFKVGGIFYNITNKTMNTVEVTYESSATSDGDYSGVVVVPESVFYSGYTYSVTSIGDGAFYGCDGLTSVTIPNSVTSIGSSAFERCCGLTEIKVESGNSMYDSRDNCNAVIETSTNTLITGCKNTIIPNSVTEIGDYAFIECTGLISITIPNSVTSIGEYAFKECTSLTTIIISNSVTLICRDAFDGCTGLTEVISLNPTPPACSSSSVFDSGIYSTAKLSVPESSVSAYKSADVWKEFYNIEAGINDVVADEAIATEVARYDANGRLLSKPAPGINIIKMSDGSTRKEWVKE